jgi:transglutaminase-like putative cysteine protease
MPIRVALHHRTTYHYDRLVQLSPQVIRLRPAPHCRTAVTAYSLKVEPQPHFLNWQQDPQSNFLARVVFPERVRHFSVDVDLVAEMTVINPFDFFLEPYAENFPFSYEACLAQELTPFRQAGPPGPKLAAYLKTVDRQERRAMDFLVALNQRLQSEVRYLIRMEPGVQTSEETLTLGSGSCRDSAWLLVEILRHLGLAARFVSGYLIQLKPDVKALDGPPGPETDFTDLHAWTEVYLPGAGWVGLDPTSGLLAGEGHLPVAATPEASSASPVSGLVEDCKVTFAHEMRVTRIREDPRVTLPYTDRQWETIDALGRAIDREIVAGDIRLTMGGEPTFVSIDDMDGAEWNIAALGPNKRVLAERLLDRLRTRLAPEGFLHSGQGKWYPGEPLPRWALACYWRMGSRCGMTARCWPRRTAAMDSDR